MLVDGSFKSLLQGVSQQPDRSRIEGQCTAMTNMVADAVDGLRRRPPVSYTANIGTIGALDKWYDYDTGSEAYAILFQTDKAVRVFDLDGVEKTVVNTGTGYLSSDPKADLRLVTIGDYTICSNVQVDTAMDTDTHVTASGALIYFRDGGEYGRKYEVHIEGVLAAFYTTPGGSTPATDAAKTGTTYVANQIYLHLTNQVNDAGAAPNPTELADYDFTLVENVISVIHKYTPSLDMDLRVSDDRGGLFALIVQKTLRTTASLPLYALPGMVVAITGDGAAAVNDIYMEATGTGSALIDVVWREAVARDITYKFDPDTMPHALVRTADGNFYFGPLDGSTRGTTVIEEWRERAAGDNDSNPIRAFINRPVEFVTSFQERLVMLSGDYLIMSSTNSFFNFFNTTATALLKSDPIELANPATRSTALKVAIQHSKNLVVFSEDTQFIIGGANGVTPETAAMAIATNFQADLTAVPVAAGANVFFGITYGVYGGVRELFTDNISAAQDSRTITEHIKRYMAGNISLMQVSSNLGILALLSDAAPNTVYIYQYLWDGENRLQSAWSEWKFEGFDIDHFFFIGSDLYIIAKDPAGGSYVMGYLDTTDSSETGLEFNIYLDRKEQVTPVNKVFTITNLIPDMEDLVVVHASDSLYPGMSAKVESIVAGVVTLATDPEGDVIIGIPYRSSYTPTMPILKDQNGVVISTDKLIVNQFNIAYKNTHRFKVDIVDIYSGTTTQEFTGRVVGAINNLVGVPSISTGLFLAGVRKDRDYASVVIYTDSHGPLALIDIEWTGQFTKHGRRF